MTRKPKASDVQNDQNGDPGRTRTPNILIRSQVLYPVELRDHLCPFMPQGANEGKSQSVRVMKVLSGSAT